MAPRSPTEEVVAEIWQEVLGTERVGVQDSFFALGGHSLLALRVVSRVEKEFGVRLPLKAMFGANTVEALAAKVDEMLLHEASDERIDELLRLLEEAEGEEDEIDKKASS